MENQVVCRATAICEKKVKSVVCIVDRYGEESVSETIHQLFEVGLGQEFFEQGFKLLIDLAPAANLNLMHDPGCIFNSLHNGQLMAAIGGELVDQREHSVRYGDTVDNLGAVEKPLLTKEICGSFHSLENVKEHAPPLAGASVGREVWVVVTLDHVNRAASGGCSVSSC